jgi:hypothetical protein
MVIIYSDKASFELMDLVNPSDSLMEAKMKMLMKKYENLDIY